MDRETTETKMEATIMWIYLADIAAGELAIGEEVKQ